MLYSVQSSAPVAALLPVRIAWRGERWEIQLYLLLLPVNNVVCGAARALVTFAKFREGLSFDGGDELLDRMFGVGYLVVSGHYGRCSDGHLGQYHNTGGDSSELHADVFGVSSNLVNS
ncbi:uncharacterized protein PG998_005034 [Apiospora kogelbergensis]|uniref:uncharacterized protein n=1 Tax=Apiospora kogelbergensis TaxID=1337665 RepID=UPI00313049EB